MPGCEVGHWPADHQGRCPECFEQIEIPVLLSPQQRDILAGLIRDGIKKADRGILKGRAKWADYDDQPDRERISMLLAAYQRMGLDPTDFARPHQSEPCAPPAADATETVRRALVHAGIPPEEIGVSQAPGCEGWLGVDGVAIVSPLQLDGSVLFWPADQHGADRRCTSAENAANKVAWRRVAYGSERGLYAGTYVDVGVPEFYR